ncbi:MAG: lactate racemase domain-containing protein [Promethearchaeota archaeon]
MGIHARVSPGESIAITAGSRGIRHMLAILQSIVRECKEMGAKPFIFPAMGSHGGGTSEGQVQVLANYGITEGTLGCPIRATMDVDVIGETKAPLNTPVYMDRFAAAADHIIVVNRIKPHTKFVGRIESGLMKMCLIGMGKREGARTYHRAVAHHTWNEIAAAVTDIIVQKVPILAGIAILQNAHEELAELKSLLSYDLADEEPKLLERAYSLMGRIPFPQVDLLIVDEMGKEFSGTGMDSNITGRKEGAPPSITINVHRIYVRSLSQQSHGNAQGIGLADFTQRSLVDEIDYSATYINSQTAYRSDTCKIPMTLENDREALRIATQMAGLTDDSNGLRVVWIKNTLELDEMYVSEAFLPQISALENVEIIDEGYIVQFSAEGEVTLINTNKQ